MPSEIPVIHTDCHCGCGNGLRVVLRAFSDEDFVFIDTTTSCYYAHQLNFWSILRRRFQAAWHMLRGKEYCLHEIVLSREEWKDFVSRINAADQAVACKGVSYDEV